MHHCHPHAVIDACHCSRCKPFERPCGCSGCAALLTPAAAAAMTKDEAAAVLATIRGGGWFDATKDEALRLAIAALTAPAGVPDGWTEDQRIAAADAAGQALIDRLGKQLGFTINMGDVHFMLDKACAAARNAAAAPPSDAPGEGKLTPGGQASEYDVPGNELPGMWDRADFMGGSDELPRSITGLSPSPAEQGAREEWSADAVVATLEQITQARFTLHDERLPSDVLNFLRGLAMRMPNCPGPPPAIAPLAAGRVGVAEAGIERAAEALFRHDFNDSDQWHNLKGATRDDYIESARICAKALAGPLVAGEVEAVAWALLSRGRSGTVHRMLLDKCPPDDALGDHQTIRPLVYADTAKAGES